MSRKLGADRRMNLTSLAALLACAVAGNASAAVPSNDGPTSPRALSDRVAAVSERLTLASPKVKPELRGAIRTAQFRNA
jgi:hypothetical protein